MEVVICKNSDEVASVAADMVAELVRRKPNCVLGLATGGTPVETYRQLILKCKQGLSFFAKVHSFNLDEYYPIEPDHDQSYRYFMNKNFFDGIDINPEWTEVPDGRRKPNRQAIDEMCADYEAKIKQLGGIDLQILGVGSNGHIAFDEPGSSLQSRTRIVALTKSTIEDNSRFFANKEDVPKFAITMGIGTILEARQVILLATGSGKAQAVARAIEGPLASACPASALQFHPDAHFIIDAAASSKLVHESREYFQHVRELMGQL